MEFDQDQFTHDRNGSEQAHAESAEYNAYRDDLSVEALVKATSPDIFLGDEPFPGEPSAYYHDRRMHELTEMRRQSRRLLRSSANRAGLLLLLYFVISTTLQIVLSLLSISPGGDFWSTDLGATLLMAVAYILVYPATFPIAIYVGDIGEKRTLKSYLRKPDCSPWYILKSAVFAIGAAYLASIAVNIVTSLMTAFTGIEIYDPATATVFTSPLDAVVYFIALCVFAPLFEELFFRGTLLAHHLKFGGWHAVIVSSLMFGLFHQNLQQLVYAAVTGAIFALIVVKTGSLIPSMIIHFSFNLIAYLQMLTGYFIDNYDALISGESTVAEGSPLAVTLFTFFNYLPYLMIIAAIIIFAVDMLSNRSAFHLPCGDSRLTEREKNEAFFGSPAIIAVIAIFGLIIAFYAIFYPMLL